MLKTKFCLGAAAIVLVACSQPEPMMEITPEPIYNKMGEVTGCTDSAMLPNSTWENPCVPPDDCVIITASNICDPYPGRDPQDDGREPDRDPNPTTGTRTG